MNWTAQQLADIVAGELHADTGLVVSGIATDTRTLRSGEAFIAIRGDNFDGADFAAQAMDAGAVLIVAERQLEQPCIVVEDATTALGAIAAAHLRDLPQVTVVGITGSSGKTSTKDLVAHVLARAGATVAPVGSFNNDFGLPRTVLQADSATRFLVLEMGMRGLGQIARLCRIAPPDVAVVLNVGSAHAGEIGSRDDTAKGKGEIIRGLRSNGIAVINRDDAYADRFTDLAPGATLEFGMDEGFVHASSIALDELARATFMLHIGGECAPVRLQLLGEHNVANALAAATIAHACGLPLSMIADALSAATLRSHGRMERFELDNGVTLIDDSYNANPESMRTALRALATIGRHRRTWAVLGEMRELGDLAVEEHDAVGRLAVRLDISHLVAVGDMGRIMCIGATNEGSWGDEAAHVADADAAADYVVARWGPGDVVLVKASRSIHLERVAEALRVAGSRKD